jgi:hypothetical protein
MSRCKHSQTYETAKACTLIEKSVGRIHELTLTSIHPAILQDDSCYPRSRDCAESEGRHGPDCPAVWEERWEISVAT